MIVLAAAVVLTACKKDDDENSLQRNQLVTNVIVPSGTFYTSTVSELTIQGKGFRQGDRFYLVDGNGKRTQLNVTKIDNKYFTFSVPTNLESGSFVLLLERDGQQQKLGVLKLRRSISLDVPDKQDNNIKGAVFCGEEAVVGAVVSDGRNVAVTDSDGYYWLQSDKHHGYVFISFPSGYEPLTESGIPQIWSNLDRGAEGVEQHNFELVKADNDEHVLLAFADMHLANRENKDIDQFRQFFVPDATALAQTTYAGKKVYAVNLGDMSWDTFWYSGRWGSVRYDILSYKSLIQSLDLPFMVFHLPGNHDNDPYQKDDFAPEQPYKDYLGPTYYSFNIGGIHYVMLDNVIYNNPGANPPSQIGNTNGYQKALTDIQIEWLKNDLALVDKNTPLVVGQHCPAYYSNNSAFENRNALSSDADKAKMMECFDGFTNIHFLSGHTHNNINMPVSSRDKGANADIYEHNTAAVCATWWWSGYHTSADGWKQISKDGSPGGYGVYEINGTDIEWYYKGNGLAREKQFRTYDMNVVKNFFATNPNALRYYTAMPDQKGSYDNVGDNVVFLNVWNWDENWKITVKEGNNPLTVTRLFQKDPMHIITYDIARYIQHGSITTDFLTPNNNHMFYVTCSNQNSTLQIEIEDRFGNKYTEQMLRPKDFNVNAN